LALGWELALVELALLELAQVELAMVLVLVHSQYLLAHS